MRNRKDVGSRGQLVLWMGCSTMKMLIKGHAACPRVPCLPALATSWMHSSGPHGEEPLLGEAGACSHPPTHSGAASSSAEPSLGFPFFPQLLFSRKFYSEINISSCYIHLLYNYRGPESVERERTDSIRQSEKVGFASTSTA